MSQNKVTFGLEKLHIAFKNKETGDWKNPLPIPGVVGLTTEPEGEMTPFHADNMTYYVSSSNNGYTGDLETALFPDAVLAEMWGWIIDNNGALIEIADGIPAEFALMGQVLGDARNRRFVYYNCVAGRASKERTTTSDTIEPSTETVPVTMSPIEVDGRKIVKGDLELSETNATVFNSFFTSVYKPVISTGGEETGE